jgi:radical SAM enzyme (TIGR01210 family)
MQKAGKEYTFNNSHDKTRPAGMWFQESNEGVILFIVFYSLACRWYRCLGCNLPSQMSSEHVSYKSLIAQVNSIFKNPEVIHRRDSIQKVIISNNGSVLDQKTFSSTALMYLLAMFNLNLPNMSVLSIETRPEYVESSELEFISRALEEGETPTNLEIAIGFEAFDDHIRNEIFDKGLSLEVFERLVSNMALYGFRLKCYFMQKPVPGMTDDEAVEDIRNAIDYLSGMAAKYNININMHLNPTYAARGTLLEKAFLEKEYTPPFLRDVVRSVRYARGKRLSVYIGLSDEGLAVDGGSFLRKGDESLLELLEKFNRTQEYDNLE